MPERAKAIARRQAGKLTARHTDGTPTNRVPSAEGVRLWGSTLPLPGSEPVAPTAPATHK